MAPNPSALMNLAQRNQELIKTLPPELADAVKSNVRPGRMYEVNINAHPDQFLDWDKPLSQQSPQTQAALKQTMGPNWDQFKSAKAGDAVKQGFISPGEETTAAQLHQSGIPGIKYLDQGSRSAGEGSRNYVVFNDKLIDILKKYGLAGAMASPAFGQMQSSPAYGPQQQNPLVNALQGGS
jgi:hypothetical protein